MSFSDIRLETLWSLQCHHLSLTFLHASQWPRLNLQLCIQSLRSAKAGIAKVDLRLAIVFYHSSNLISVVLPSVRVGEPRRQVQLTCWDWYARGNLTVQPYTGQFDHSVPCQLLYKSGFCNTTRLLAILALVIFHDIVFDESVKTLRQGSRFTAIGNADINGQGSSRATRTSVTAQRTAKLKNTKHEEDQSTPGCTYYIRGCAT